MHRYYFHITEDDRPFPDLEGVEFSDDAAAIEAAAKLLEELVTEFGPGREQSIQVLDIAGRVITRIHRNKRDPG